MPTNKKIHDDYDSSGDEGDEVIISEEDRSAIDASWIALAEKIEKIEIRKNGFVKRERDRETKKITEKAEEKILEEIRKTLEANETREEDIKNLLRTYWEGKEVRTRLAEALGKDSQDKERLVETEKKSYSSEKLITEFENDLDEIFEESMKLTLLMKSVSTLILYHPSVRKRYHPVKIALSSRESYAASQGVLSDIKSPIDWLVSMRSVNRFQKRRIEQAKESVESGLYYKPIRDSIVYLIAGLKVVETNVISYENEKRAFTRTSKNIGLESYHAILLQIEFYKVKLSFSDAHIASIILDIFEGNEIFGTMFDAYWKTFFLKINEKSYESWIEKVKASEFPSFIVNLTQLLYLCEGVRFPGAFLLTHMALRMMSMQDSNECEEITWKILLSAYNPMSDWSKTDTVDEQLKGLSPIIFFKVSHAGGIHPVTMGGGNMAVLEGESEPAIKEKKTIEPQKMKEKATEKEEGAEAALEAESPDSAHRALTPRKRIIKTLPWDYLREEVQLVPAERFLQKFLNPYLPYQKYCYDGNKKNIKSGKATSYAFIMRTGSLVLRYLKFFYKDTELYKKSYSEMHATLLKDFSDVFFSRKEDTPDPISGFDDGSRAADSSGLRADKRNQREGYDGHEAEAEPDESASAKRVKMR